MIEQWLPHAASERTRTRRWMRVLLSVHTHMLLIFAAWLALFVVALIKFRRGANPDARVERRARFVAGARDRRGDRRRRDHPCHAGAAGLGRAQRAAARRRASDRDPHRPPSSSPGTFTIRVRTACSAGSDNALISATNPVGIDRDDPAAADDIGLLNVLMLPVNRTAVIRVTSRDVIHSFTLNEMRVKQDAMPGMTARVWFTPIDERATGRSRARSYAGSATTACAANTTSSIRTTGTSGRPTKWRGCVSSASASN